MTDIIFFFLKQGIWTCKKTGRVHLEDNKNMKHQELEGAHQPQSSEDNSKIIFFKGEVQINLNL